LLLVLVAGLAFAWTVEAPSAAQAGPVDRAMLDTAPDILQFLHEHQYQRVGILKFRVEKDGKEPSSNVGPLNLLLAKRLERALLLKYDLQKDQDLTLLHDVSAVATTLPGADHLTAEGRTRLFEGNYRPLWGNVAAVRADAFLSGRAEFSKDLTSLTVRVCAFGQDATMHKVTTFHARTDLDTLVEAGESFNLRALVRGDGTVEEVDVIDKIPDEVQKTKQGVEDNKLLKEDQAVALEIHYVDRLTNRDRIIPVTVVKGVASAEEPRETESVYFSLIRKDPTNARYGVLLMVNGLNTLYEERLPPKDCHKWIIDPGAPIYRIDGFQVNGPNGERSVPFVVRSAAESEAAAIRYGANVGTFSFSVFREQPPVKEKPGDLDAKVAKKAAKREESAVANPPVPSDLPQDPGPAAPLPADARSAKKQLEEGIDKFMGLIEKGEGSAESNVKHVGFTNPILVQTVTIHYYRPGQR
jgi:hypothetical protein